LTSAKVSFISAVTIKSTPSPSSPSSLHSYGRSIFSDPSSPATSLETGLRLSLLIIPNIIPTTISSGSHPSQLFSQTTSPASTRNPTLVPSTQSNQS
jgi:hypothetical protein